MEEGQRKEGFGKRTDFGWCVVLFKVRRAGDYALFKIDRGGDPAPGKTNIRVKCQASRASGF